LIKIFRLTTRQRNQLAFGGTILLCFLTVLLIDLQLYLSAGFTGVVAIVGLCALLMRSFRQRKDTRERGRNISLKAEKRAAVAEARSEKINRTKAAVVEAAKGLRSVAADFVDATKTRVRGVRGRLRFWRSKNEPE
jgi:hypothetical protein